MSWKYEMIPEPGDWIAFQLNGKIKHGLVLYVRKTLTYPNSTEIHTTNGITDSTSVLEIRKPSLLLQKDLT